MTTTTHTTDGGFENVWTMFQELHRQFQAMQALLKEKSEETDRQFKETDKHLKEKFEETDQQFKATNRKLNRLSDLFEGQWGKLIEILFQGDALRLFQERGLKVN